MKFSELITKPVISLYEGNVEGFVINAIFSSNMKKIKSLILENAQDDNSFDEYLIDSKNIFKIGKDAIMIKNKFLLDCNNNYENLLNPINYSVFTTNGINLGKINDLILNDNFEIEKYICGENEFSCEQIAKINRKVILINTKDYSVNVNKFKHKVKCNIQNLNNNQKAIILPIQTNLNQSNIFGSPYFSNSNIEQDTVEDKQEIEQQKKLNTNPIPRLNTQKTNLIGRTITQSIITQNGELIAKQGNVVTETTINLASAHQKLRELSFYVK